MDNVKSASDRFFRLYYKHCVQPDLDTLFNLLNATHSLNDRLNKSIKVNFFDCKEFIALKSLRNLFHHKEELLNELRIIPVKDLPPITTDLLFLCLVPASLIENAIEQIEKKYRETEKPIIRSVLGWYGEVVNINPCIFNFAVKVYEKLSETDVKLDSDEFKVFRESYIFETENGYSHYISGEIGCHASSVNEVIKKAFDKVV